MPTAKLYHRHVESRLREALADSPVVLVHGPRQCGKTTLARELEGPKGYAYVTFDDGAVSASAKSDPTGFVERLPDRVILDEVQRVPEIFLPIKLAVDRRRDAGRFLLTGSTNVLLVPTLADSLAGRLSIVRLHPLAQTELERESPSFPDRLFAGKWRATTSARSGIDLSKRIAGGGFPAALARTGAARRSTWYRDYVETLVQRDVRDLARISTLDALPRLLGLIAGQTARLINFSELSAPFHLSRPTIRDYVTLLERVFLLDTLPPWHSNRLSRLVKTPKIHVGDTGVACALLGVDATALDGDRTLLGQLLETFVYQELRRQCSASDTATDFFHFRDRDGVEVDLVLERGARAVAGVEVKASATVTSSDFAGLRKLAAAAGNRFKGGVVLYDGEASVPFGEKLFALPVRTLWDSDE